MQRAECKGRTLCLKVKLHTFEVLTRQVVPPKAVWQADDLYNYSLPMLEKLEKDFPSMKLRLMGLRCTQLQSSKPPDTMAFFGLRRRQESGQTTGHSAQAYGDEEWEQWPDEALNESGERNESGEDGREPEPNGQTTYGDSPYRRHGKEILPNPGKAEVVEEELWDCPICARPQPADEKQFNDHIDLCLSRRAIRDTVQKDAAAQSSSSLNSRSTTPEAKKVKKRGRSTTTVDPRQKKLCFG